MSAIVDFLAPFSWGTVFFWGGLVSMQHGENWTCGGGAAGGGVGGVFMGRRHGYSYLRNVSLGASVLMVMAACCPSYYTPVGVDPIGGARRECACTSWTRKTVSKRVVPTSWASDLGWQVHGAVIWYRIGALSLTSAVLVGLFGGLGKFLAWLGSMAPKEALELVGPVSV